MNDSIQMTSPPQPLRYLVFSASLREDSLNTRLAHLAADIIQKRPAVQRIYDTTFLACGGHRFEFAPTRCRER